MRFTRPLLHRAMPTEPRQKQGVSPAILDEDGNRGWATVQHVYSSQRASCSKSNKSTSSLAGPLHQVPQPPHEKVRKLRVSATLGEPHPNTVEIFNHVWATSLVPSDREVLAFALKFFDRPTDVTNPREGSEDERKKSLDHGWSPMHTKNSLVRGFLFA